MQRVTAETAADGEEYGQCRAAQRLGCSLRGKVMEVDPPTSDQDLPADPLSEFDKSRAPIDWIRADLRDEERTLTWYVDRAEEGDQHAALRALELCVQSLSLAALRQNGMKVDHLLADALRRILGSGDDLGDSRALRAARGKKGGRGKVDTVNEAKWWLCYEMHRLLQSRPRLTQELAAEQVLGAPDVKYQMTPESLRRAYSELLPSIAVDFLEVQDDGEICGPWRFPDGREEK